MDDFETMYWYIESNELLKYTYVTEPQDKLYSQYLEDEAIRLVMS